MNCRKAQAWISLDLDGELPATRREVLEAHLAGCATCRSARAQWTAAGDRLRQRAALERPTAEAAWAGVLREIRRERPAPVPAAAWGWGLRWAGAAAVVALAVTLGLLLRGDTGGRVASRAAPARVEWVETGLPGAAPMVYEDEETGWVVIWVVEQRESGHAGS